MGRPDSVFTLAVTLGACFNAQAAERETRQMAKEQQQQLTSLRRPIEERSDLIQRVKAVQAAQRERHEAKAHARRRSSARRAQAGHY